MIPVARMDKKPGQQPPKDFRDLGATTLFRITNFELYAKPRKPVMFFGLTTFSICCGYLLYMNLTYDDQLQKENAILNQEEKVKSRWD